MHYKGVMEKDEKSSLLKDHVEKLLAQVKKTKVTEGTQEALIETRRGKFTFKEP